MFITSTVSSPASIHKDPAQKTPTYKSYVQAAHNTQPSPAASHSMSIPVPKALLRTHYITLFIISLYVGLVTQFPPLPMPSVALYDNLMLPLVILQDKGPISKAGLLVQISQNPVI